MIPCEGSVNETGAINICGDEAVSFDELIADLTDAKDRLESKLRRIHATAHDFKVFTRRAGDDIMVYVCCDGEFSNEEQNNNRGEL